MMTGPKQRTTLLAATLAILVSGGVALQAFAETPGMLDHGQAAFGGASTGSAVASLANQAANLTTSGVDQAAFDAFAADRFVTGAVATGALSNQVGNLLASQTVTSAADIDFTSALAAFTGANAAPVSFAAPVAGDALQAAMRTVTAGNSRFAADALKPGFDPSAMVAAYGGASTGRFGFATALDAGQIQAAFAAQTDGASDLTDAMRTDRDDSGLFANPVPTSGANLDLEGLAAALGEDGAVTTGRLAQGATNEGLQAAMRAESVGSGLFANPASSSLPASELAVDLDELAAALSSDSMEQGALAADASLTGVAAAMRAETSGSALFANAESVTGPYAVDFARIGAALAGDD